MKLNEIIDERMKYRGVNQTEICKECNLTVQNFNAFVKGKRTLPKESLFKVMAHLKLYYKKKDEEPIAPTNVDDEIISLLRNSGKKLTEIAKETNISASTLSSIINGKRQMSPKAIGALAEYFGFQVLSL